MRCNPAGVCWPLGLHAVSCAIVTRLAGVQRNCVWVPDVGLGLVQGLGLAQGKPVSLVNNRTQWNTQQHSTVQAGIADGAARALQKQFTLTVLNTVV